MLLNRLFRSARFRPSAPRPRPAAGLSLEALNDRIVPASLSVNDVSIVEGAGTTERALVRVTLDAPRTQTVSVNYATANGTATAGSDYIAVSGQLFFNPGETSKEIIVPILSDALSEGKETFFVNLKNAKQAKIGDGRGVITILDDRPSVHISETFLSPTLAEVTVSLSAAYDQPVTAAYSSTSFPNSYISPIVPGVLTFSPGETTKSFTVFAYPVPPGTNDAFRINLSVTYADGVVVNSFSYGYVGHYDVPPDDPWS
jgi:hypothetical protein